MTAVRHLPRFDHGAALRVPPAHDAKGRSALWAWLGDAGSDANEPGCVRIHSAFGVLVARPGDWIVLSVSGDFHVARSSPALDS
jgi:hypothetical protein